MSVSRQTCPETPFYSKLMQSIESLSADFRWQSIDFVDALGGVLRGSCLCDDDYVTD